MTMETASPMVAIGQEAPDFELRDTEGQIVKLSDFRGERNVLLLFYPFAFSGVCHSEFCELRDRNVDLMAGDTEVIGISIDHVFTLRAWKEQEKFPNRFVADFWPHGAVSQAYGAFNHERGMSLRHGFLIDKRGIIRFIDRVETRTARDQDAWREALASLGTD